MFVSFDSLLIHRSFPAYFVPDWYRFTYCIPSIIHCLVPYVGVFIRLRFCVVIYSVVWILLVNLILSRVVFVTAEVVLVDYGLRRVVRCGFVYSLHKLLLRHSSWSCVID